MYASLVLSAALIAPAAPLPRDAAPNTTGPAPRVLALKADAGGAVRVTGTIPVRVTVTQTHFVIENVVVNGQQVQQQVQKQVEQDITTSQYMNKALSEFNGTFATADGAPLTVEEATARVKNGATVLASADGKPVAKTWLRAVGGDTVVMIADGLSHVQPQSGGGVLPTTPAPRLAMLGTDDTGKVAVFTGSRDWQSTGGTAYTAIDYAAIAKTAGGSRLDRNPMYMIEKLGPAAGCPLESHSCAGGNEGGGGIGLATYFRVTARSTGGDPRVVRTTESVYAVAR